MLNKITAHLNQIPILTAVAVFFILGIVIAYASAIPFFVWFIWCALSLVIAVWSKEKDALFSFIFLVFCFGLGALHCNNYLFPHYRHNASLNLQHSLPVHIEGIIENDPAYSARKVSFILNSKKLIVAGRDYEMKGYIVVNVFKKEKFAYGDSLILEGRLYRPFNFGGKSFSYREYLKNQGIAYILSVTKEDGIVFLQKAQSNRVKAFALKAKHTFKSIFEAYLWPENSRILSGIILGERQNFPHAIRDAFVRTGTSHIIAISGFNVGIVAFVVLIILKALGIKRKPRYYLTIPLLIMHMYAVGASASVVRATIMAIIVLSGYLMERESQITNSLGLAALIILGANPLQLFDIGFQLSFVSVLGIVLLSGRIESFLGARGNPVPERPSAVNRLTKTAMQVKKWSINCFSVSLAAWFVTAGAIAYYFRIVSPITVLANLIIVPYTSLIIVLGFSLGLSALIFPAIAAPIAATTNYSLGFLLKITHWLSSIPGAYFYLPR
ncbi:MAG: hypothetical protein A2Y00_09680 [Omnitrophica WOR_2 bacterium GWF2_43_52]|nr:MAG: hypothetical protein A2Y00_09680 [Omnitrophica WOR_2 bacterium GWF2_43_52]HAH19386.1 hypothetical protein [Candidatus Omnitrophota bacterium]HBG63757.1 hypothetical protein [Candidatus Omnitrophota bacterium]HCD39340.1 hypothetical protein [Candidatus Omnitrophota bacterium]